MGGAAGHDPRIAGRFLVAPQRQPAIAAERVPPVQREQRLHQHVDEQIPTAVMGQLVRQREIARLAVVEREEARRQRDHRIEHAHGQRGIGGRGLDQAHLAEQARGAPDLAALGQQLVAQGEIGGKAQREEHPCPAQPEQQQGLGDGPCGERGEEIEPGRLDRRGRYRRRGNRFPHDSVGRRGGLKRRQLGRGGRRRLGRHPRGQHHRRHDQAQQRQRPEGIGRLGAEMARHGAAQHQHRGDQHAGPGQRLEQHRAHGRSSFSRASISARSSSVSASVSARCATSEAARPPNRRSTSRRLSPST